MADDTRRFTPYAEFQKTIDRIRTLYEATMHSYDLMYNSGLEQLKDPTNREAKVRFEFGGKSVERPLKLVTGHSRDVYPQLLRSTLLVRVVAGYEAFLVDMVAEVSRRSDTPFASDGRIDMSHAEVLQIDQTIGVRTYVINKILRGLTSGGIEEIRKFFQRRLLFDIVAKMEDYEKIAEIHQRRHLYVHRGGRADVQYIRRFKPNGLAEDQVLSVPEDYFLASIALLRSSGLHIKAEMERRYPTRVAHRYTKGEVELPAHPEVVLAISFDVQDELAATPIMDLSLPVGRKLLKDLVLWVSTDSRCIRMVVACDQRSSRQLWKGLVALRDDGVIARFDAFKIRR